jgi:glucan phosphoethanolaminetransferase (alkaline phosphatase superfamily)
MQFNYKSEIKTWTVYFITIIVAVFVHELGHCMVAWVNGIEAVPTPAKTYLPQNIPVQLVNTFAAGGILGTIVFSLLVVSAYSFSKFNLSSAILAGALANPGMYSFLFFLKGRGHNGTEFQRAQAALGFQYSGHFLDWFLFILFVVGAIAWAIITRPAFRTVPRILLGIIISILFLTILQNLNNKIFDPIFLRNNEVMHGLIFPHLK